MPRSVAIVRPPGERLAEGIVTHLERRPVDVALARAQWSTYVETLAGHGREPIELPTAASPDGVFVEDTLVVYGELAVVTRPRVDARRQELASAEASARELGMTLARIEPPGTLDGGDVLIAGPVAYVGIGTRTNAEGARQLGALLGSRGLGVRRLALGRVLHLKTALGILPDGTLVGHLPALPERDRLPRLRPAPEPSGAQVLVLDERTIVLAADCPHSAELYAGLGWDVVALEIGEFQKLEGAVTCLSVLAVTP